MAEATHCDTHTEHASNGSAAMVLRTNVVLSEDDLIEEAKAQFGYHTEILRTFQLNARNILASDRLSPIGRHLFCITLEANYANCKSVLNYIAVHPELKTKANPMPPPLVVCGVSRSGTTLLYNLLACDPACRAPLFTDMMQPVPPLSRSDTAGQAQRNIAVRMFSEMLNSLGLVDYERETCASHPALAYDEDQYILLHTGVNWLHYLLSPQGNNELVTWLLNDTNKDYAYEYHKTFIQMLNSVDTPRSHWLFKAPIHGLFLDTFLRHYPLASLIMTHRRLDDALPSCARVCNAFTSAYFDSTRIDAAANKNMVAEHSLNAMDALIHRLVEFRRVNQHTPVFDLLYDDLVAQPIDTVRRIYEHFGLAWSEEFELAMQAWLLENPQGKQGRNVYTLEEFGLTREGIDQRYKEYNSMFLNPQESSKTDSYMTKKVTSAPKEH